MGDAAGDRNILFGVLAYQLGVIGREPLMAAMYSWTSDKSKDLPDYLSESGLLSTEDRRWLNEAVDRQLQKRGNDARRTLHDLDEVDSIRHELSRIAISDTAATMDAPAPADQGAKTFASPQTLLDASIGGMAAGPANGKSVQQLVDRFRIVRAHARGGLGEVFVAVDEELNREVALKQILDRHADNQISRTRFLMEAEVTGNLEHPGVVPVYGLGAQSDGRPFYAMRFIRGESLEDAIRQFHEADDDPLREPGERALQLRNLLTRFVAVCNTIEYAHSRGFVHRDIKPENIMLGPYGETLVVDWGLARPIGEGEAQSAFDSVADADSGSPSGITSTGDRPTQMGAVVGTPQFMSPEQAAGRLDLIGPVSDVYSLGATLYCLLTDQPAFIASDVRKVLADVREGKFPPPRQVRRNVPRGLESVCLRAMALDPTRRYPSAKALAGDIEHWLADEPVSALQETSMERAQRWMRRHKTWTRAAAATLVVIAAVAAVAYTREARLRGEVQTALTEEAKARNEADDARKLADRNAALAQTERQRAEGHSLRAEHQSVLALATLKSVLFDIQGKLKNVPAAHAARLSMLNTVVDGLKQVARNLETSAETDRSLVRAHLDLGDIFLQVGAIDSGRASAEAQAQFERGMEIAKKIHDADPANAVARADLAAAYQRLGDVGLQRGNLSVGNEWFEKSRELRQRLADERGGDAQSRRDLAASIQRLGIVHEQLRDLKAAKAYYLQFFELSQRLAEQDPQNAEDRRNLSVSYERMGDISLLEGDKPAAEDYFKKSLVVRRELVNSKSHGALASRDMSVTLDRLGNLALDRNDAKSATEFFRQSLDLRQSLFDADPNNVQSLRDLLVSYALLGDGALGENDLQNAAKFYQRYHGIAQRLVDGDPENVQFQRDLATAYDRQGAIMLRLGDAKSARDFYRLNYEVLKRLAEADRTNAAVSHDLLRASAMLGDLNLVLNDVADARRFFAEYVSEARRRADERPNDVVESTRLVDALLRNADLGLRLLDLDGAERDLKSAEVALKSADASERPLAMRLADATVLSLSAQLAMERREADKAADFAQKAIGLMRELAAVNAQTKSQVEPLIAEQTGLASVAKAAGEVGAEPEAAVKQPPEQIPDLLDFVAAAQLRNGDFAAAEKTLQRLADLDSKSGANLFLAARRSAAAAAMPERRNDGDPDLRKKFVEQALAYLRQADENRAFEDIVLAGRLEFASDFAALRKNKEFAALLEKVRLRRTVLPPGTT